jgi:hypothetical protein
VPIPVVAAEEEESTVAELDQVAMAVKVWSL